MLFAALYSALRLVLELIQLERKDAAGVKAEVTGSAPAGRGARTADHAGALAAWRSQILSVLRGRLP
jgi:hypothetical protein